MDKKKKFSPLYIGTGLLLAVCAVYLFVTMAEWGNQHILQERWGIRLEFLEDLVRFSNPGIEVLKDHKYVTVDWEELYPFSEETTSEEDKASGEKEMQPEAGKEEGGMLSLLKEGLTDMEQGAFELEESVENFLEDQLFLRTALLDSGACITRALHWEMSEKVKSKPYIFQGGRKGHISRCEPRVDVKESAHNVADFAAYTEEQDIPFLYVQFPCKMSNLEKEKLPEGYENYADVNTDDFLKILKDRGVNYLDMREAMRETGREPFSFFFRTDHHWTPESGMWAAGIIAENLEKYGIFMNQDFFDKNNYQSEIFEGIYLGSYGRAVTKGVIAPDDFEVITPLFDTELKIQVPGRDVNAEGDFSETLMDWGMLYQKPSYEVSQYSAYMWGDDGLIQIQNLKAENDARILIIKDSFANVVSPFLALGVKETSIIDKRVFNGSLHTYIEEFQPDLVMVCYNPNSYVGTGKIDYASHKSLMDFR